jgi:sulfite exporter TauE/SafE
MVCAPGMVSYIAVNKYSWKESAKLAIIFNLPRILVLTLFGAFVGYIAFEFSSFFDDLKGSIGNVMGIGYILLGIFLLIFGAYWLMQSIESIENRKEGKTNPPDLCKSNESDKKHGWLYTKISSKLTNPKTQPKYLFLIWGGILSVACLGEIIIIEGAVLTGAAALFGNEHLGATLLGAGTMFMFAIGATIPVVYVTIIGSTLSQYVKTQEKLDSVKTIGAIIMILIGITFILTSGGTLAA